MSEEDRKLDELFGGAIGAGSRTPEALDVTLPATTARPEVARVETGRRSVWARVVAWVGVVALGVALGVVWSYAGAAGEQGWMRVGGGEVFGGEVVIDGVVRGHAPLELQVPTGEHRVVVRRVGDGRVIVERTVVVTPKHTREAAARLR